MWGLFVRGFMWLSSGYVLNDIFSTTGQVTGLGNDQPKSTTPWWVWPSIVALSITAFIVWLTKRK